jgi:predicted phospho-2-dehydro-3-deoxyheptonate aldolase
MTGTTLRLRRLSHDGRYVIIPMDHGTSNGPIAGLKDATRAIQDADAGGATGIVVQKGLARHFAAARAQAGLIIHVSASTNRGPDPNAKRVVATADEVVVAGADAISLHINVGSDTEPDQLADLGEATAAAAAFGLPVLAMMYPRGPRVKHPYDATLVAHAARLGEELGADLVKTVYTGDVDSFADVCAGVRVPLLVAGGERMDDERQVLKLVADSMKAGAAGVSIGRNVFQHPDPRAMTAALRAIVVDGASAEEAAGQLSKAVRA